MENMKEDEEYVKIYDLATYPMNACDAMNQVFEDSHCGGVSPFKLFWTE
jgi:hypothetical protein